MKNFILKFPRQILLAFNILTLFYLFMGSATTCLALGHGIQRDHSCVIQADNTIVCWGLNKEGQAMPPSGTFLQVSVGGHHSCAIRTDKTVACWGLNKEGQATPPSGTFLQVSAGFWHTCGVKTDNTLACWGSNNPYWHEKDPYLNEWQHFETLGQATPPSGTFLQVSAGGRHTCGLRTDHTVACWGSHLSDPPILRGILGHSQSIPPSGEFSQVATGTDHSCGIRADHKMECWGGFGNFHSSPNILYSQMLGGGYMRCGLKTDNTVACFGNRDPRTNEGFRIPNSTCRCSKKAETRWCNDYTCTTSPSYTFSQILETGIFYACGIRTNNTVVCWGYDPDGQTFPPRGLIAKSSDSACLVYGVHNNDKETQFFIININTGSLEVHVRSRLEKNYKIKALDIDLSNNQLYAASEVGNLYQVRNGAQVLTEVGELGFRNVEALSFHPDGVLWGWAQGTGLFQVEKGENNELNFPGTIIVPYSGEIKIEDITWNIEGNLLYGVENLKQGSRLWAYDKSENTIHLVCQELMNSLKREVSALETLPDDILVLGFEGNKDFGFGIMDVSRCQISQGNLATPYHQVKGIAWPDCNHGNTVK